MANYNCIACSLEGTHWLKYGDSQHTCERGTATTSSAYSFFNYQQDSELTAIYPGAGTGTNSAINYTILGLGGEAGEILNKWKKLYRDYSAIAENDDYPSTIRDDIIDELGDILWYASQLATELGADLGDIAADNIRKLQSRKQRGVLGGSGDER